MEELIIFKNEDSNRIEYFVELTGGYSPVSVYFYYLVIYKIGEDAWRVGITRREQFGEAPSIFLSLNNIEYATPSEATSACYDKAMTVVDPKSDEWLKIEMLDNADIKEVITK